MANFSATITASGATATITNGAVTLNYNDTLTISIGAGFPDATATISSIEFWDVANGGGKGRNLKGTYTRNGNSQLPTGVLVAASGTGAVITDSDEGSTDENYYYDVKITDSSRRQWDADPQLVIRKKTGGQDSTPPAPEATPDP